MARSAAAKIADFKIVNWIAGKPPSVQLALFFALQLLSECPLGIGKVSNVAVSRHLTSGQLSTASSY